MSFTASPVVRKTYFTACISIKYTRKPKLAKKEEKQASKQKTKQKNEQTSNKITS